MHCNGGGGGDCNKKEKSCTKWAVGWNINYFEQMDARGSSVPYPGQNSCILS